MNPLISPDELKKNFAEFARNSEKKLTIILGAGASFGYSRDKNFIYKPPTVSELLKNESPLVQQVIEKSEHRVVKGQRAHIARSIKSLDGDLEAYLSDIYTNDTADELFPSMLRYLEDIFTLVSQNVDLEDNYYQTLLSRVRDLRGTKPWSILTFNYDTILEQSIVDIQRWVPKRVFKKDNDYLDFNPKVLKMHGGVNLRYVTIPDPENADLVSPHDVFTELMNKKEPIENYMEIIALGSKTPSFKNHRILRDVGGRVICDFPLMMVPIHTVVKSENSFFCRQVEYAKNEISQSGLVVAIGYQFGDNTFVEALKGLDLKESTLILVGTTYLLDKTIESKAFKSASKVWPKENIRIYQGNGFAEFAESLY